MTVQPTRDQLRADVELGKDLTGTYYADEDPDYYPAMKRIFEAVPQLLDQLDAAEQRIRDLTQEVRDERGAARDQMEQVRIRDARIRAVEDVLDTWMTYCQTEQTARALSGIRRALEG